MVYVEGTSVRAGRREAIDAVCEIARLVEPTLGPAGSDVVITSPFGEILTTNDGATILREVPIAHPAARIAADIALTQERAVGDGTTSAVVLAARLCEAMAPIVETRGLRVALEGLASSQLAVEREIERLARPLASHDLSCIVSTTLAGKAGEDQAELIARLMIESLPDPDAAVALIAASGAPMDRSRRIDGVLIDRLPVRSDMPRSVEKPRIALVSGALEARRAEGLSLQSTEELERYFASEENAAQTIAERIIASGATLVVCRKGVDDEIQHALSRAGVMAVRRVPLRQLEVLASATGAVIVPGLTGLEDSLGRADLVAVQKDPDGIVVTGTPEPSSTVVLRGSTDQVAEELERAAADAEGVVRSALRRKTGIPGALVLESACARLGGGDTERAVASAFEKLGLAVLGNAGIEELPRAGRGLDARSGEEIDAWKRGIIEPVEVKRAAVGSAFEIARTILRIETIVTLPDPRRNRT